MIAAVLITLMAFITHIHAGISTLSSINPIAIFTFSNSSDWLIGSDQTITLTLNQHFKKKFILKSLILVSESGLKYSVCKNVDGTQVNVACDLGPFCATTQCSFKVPLDIEDDPLIAKAHWGDCDKVIVLGPILCSSEGEESSDSIVNIIGREATPDLSLPSPSITSLATATVTILSSTFTSSTMPSTTVTSLTTSTVMSTTSTSSTSILVSPTAESALSSTDDTSMQSLVILASIVFGITLIFISMVLWFKRKQVLEDRMLRNQEISQMLPESFPKSKPAESPFIPRPSAYYIPENVLVQPSESYMPLYNGMHYPQMENQNHSMNTFYNPQSYE